MPDKTITELSTLDINILSKEQYQELLESSEIDENALYLTPEGNESYDDLSHKPSINDVELSGDLSLNDIGAQAKLTPGSGIHISVDSEGRTVISSTGGGAANIIAGNGIVITDIPEGSVISLDSLILDCGTSTINV